MTDDNVKQILDAARDKADTIQSSEADAIRTSEEGQINLQGHTFVKTDSITEQSFVGDDVIEDDSVSLKLVYGEAWIDADVVNRGISRDNIDPSQIVDEFEILTGVGETGGLVVESDDPTGGGASILMNGIGLALAGVGAYKILNWAYKNHISDDGETLWDNINPFTEVGDTDPVTGKEIKVENKTPNPKITEASDVTPAATPIAGSVLVRDDDCGWIEQQIEGNIVQDDDVEVATNICTLNFGNNLTVTFDGNRKITVDAAGASSGAPDQDLWKTFVGNTGSTVANSLSDILTVTGGTDIATTITGDTLTINYTGSSTGEVNTGSNVGTGEPVFKFKSGLDFVHQTLKSVDPGIFIATVGNEIHFSHTEIVEADNPCDDEGAPIAGAPVTVAPATARSGATVLPVGSAQTSANVEVLNTDCIRVHFRLDGLFTEKTFSLPNQQISTTFPSAQKFPLEAEENTQTVTTKETGSVTFLIEIISDPTGSDIVIHSEKVTFSGFNPGALPVSREICWNVIDNVGCLNKFPGALISASTNVRLRLTRQDALSSADTYFVGYSTTPGNDSFDGGNNKSRDASTVPSNLEPPADPAINITGDNLIPAYGV